MSGPKAVRVISREEQVARCMDLLSQLEAQVSEWTRMCEQIGSLNEKDRAGAEERVNVLRELLAADRFTEVEQKTPVVIEFFRRDLDERIANHVTRKQRQKIVQRRLSIAAEQVLGLVAVADHKLNNATKSVLESAVRGTVADSDVIEGAINAALEIISSEKLSNELTPDQATLAQSLRGNANVQVINDWIVENEKLDYGHWARVDGYIADLEVSEGPEAAASYAERARTIRDVESVGKRRILFDSLILDLAAEVKVRKRKRSLHAEALSIKAVIERDSELSNDGVYRRISNLLTQWDRVKIDLAERVISDAAEAVRKRHAERAAQLNRLALLEAFSELGYEIRDELETAWVNERRIVVRKSALLDRGVEVSGRAEGGRVQVRPVRFNTKVASKDNITDSDIETIWCSEFSELRQILARKGGGVIIERAKAIGESPVKVVPSPAAAGIRDSTRTRNSRMRSQE